MSTDYGPAIDLQDSRIGWGGWQPSNRRWIIVHGTAGDATVQAVQATFINNAARGAPSSTHYAVGESGEVAQYVPESGVAWGNGPISGPSGIAVAGTGNAHDSWWDQFANANPETLSIEHCKSDQSNNAPLTTVQTGASFALIRHLCDRWNIPKRVYSQVSYATLAQGGITGHFSMDPINRQFCPGTFPWQALQVYLDGSGGPVGIVLDFDASGAIVGAHNANNTALHVRAGMAKELAHLGWIGQPNPVSISVSETPPLAEGETVAVVRGGQKAAMTYTPGEGVKVYGGTVAAAVQDLASLLAGLGKLP